MQTFVDGDYCNGVVRQMNISYICNTAATVPTIGPLRTINCHYAITVQTSAVCNTPFVLPCGGAGVDLTSSLGGTTLSATVGSYYWSVAPCGNVSNPLYPGCTGQACQSSSTISNYDAAAAQYYLADNGLIQQTQNGAVCNGCICRENYIAICLQSFCHQSMDFRCS